MPYRTRDPVHKKGNTLEACVLVFTRSVNSKKFLFQYGLDLISKTGVPLTVKWLKMFVFFRLFEQVFGEP